MQEVITSCNQSTVQGGSDVRTCSENPIKRNTSICLGQLFHKQQQQYSKAICV